MKRTLLLISLWFSVCAPAIAAPVVTSISGTVAHNQVATVSGSGFGVKSPVAPLLWDPIDDMYPSIVEGGAVPTGSGYVWNSSGGSDMYNPTFRIGNLRGKYNAKYTNALSPSSVKNAVLGGKAWAECAGTKLYVSYWLYPYTSISSPGFSNKLMRLTNDGGYEFGDKSTVVWGYGGEQIIAHSIVEDYVGVIWVNYGDVGEWNRLEVTVDNSTNPKPTVSAFTNNVSQGYFTASASISDIKGIYTIGADWTNEQNTPIPIIDFGEIYVDNTLSRVEICNAATKSASTHCEIQIPQNTWSTNQIEVKVNQGSFTDGSTAYLYVVDSTGAVNSTGKAVTFDAAQADTSPTAFAFGDVTDASLSTLYTSNAITVTGINWPSAISITGGEYEKNSSGTWTSSAGTVTLNDTVRVRQTSAGDYGTQTNTVLTIGGVSDTYSVTTAAAAGDAQVLFYFNADTKGTAVAPQKGSGTIDSSQLTVTTGVVGNALYTTGSWQVIEIPTSGNIAPGSAWTIGFYYKSGDGGVCTIFLKAEGETSPYFHAIGTGSSTYTFGFMDSYNMTTFSLTPNTWTFIEISGDTAAGKMSYRINGGSWVEKTELSGTAVSTSYLLFGNHNGITVASYYDQIIFANAYRKDLYSVRNNTGF